MTNTVGLIGAGVMGEALLSGLLRAGAIGEVIVAEKRPDRAAALAAKYQVEVLGNIEVAGRADTLLLVVKPPASSRDRSRAASIAAMNEACTRRSSSCRTAATVVPAGELTFSRSTVGCSPVSRSIAAAPTRVCTTSSLDVVRGSPKNTPASIMASTT